MSNNERLSTGAQTNYYYKLNSYNFVGFRFISVNHPAHISPYYLRVQCKIVQVQPQDYTIKTHLFIDLKITQLRFSTL